MNKIGDTIQRFTAWEQGINWRVLGIVTATTMVLAGGCGMAVMTTYVPDPIVTQGPDRIVTKEVEVIVEKKVFVNRGANPQACYTALDSAAVVLTAVGVEHKAFSRAADKALVDYDITAFIELMAVATTDMNAVITEQTPIMKASAKACRAGEE